MQVIKGGILRMQRSLLHSLRRGGFILYTRHAEATVGEDLPNLNFQNCFTQRNLSDFGRQQAVYYGEILRYLGIPISLPVFTSPFCRNIETAQLAFGNQNITVDPFWFDIYRLGKNIPNKEQKRILTNLQAVFETNPPAETNKVIIGHSFPKVVGFGEIPNMGTIVVYPRGQGHGFGIVGRLSLSDLSDFALGLSLYQGLASPSILYGNYLNR